MPGRKTNPRILVTVPMRVLMITTEWPSTQNPNAVPFLVRQVEFLRRAGLNVYVFHFKGAGNPFNYLKAWFSFQKVRKKYHPDIIHAQWGQSVIPSLPKNTPLVITYRGDDLEGVINRNGRHGLKSYILRTAGRFVARFADRIMVVSPHLLNKFSTSVPVYVVPSGLDFSKMPNCTKEQAKYKLGLPSGKRIVIFPNSKENKRKNLDLVLKTLDCLPEKDRNRIFFHHAFGMPYELLMLHMKAADFLVFTSLHEGSPNVVKEAIANDVAVVSVPVGDTRVRLENVPGCGVSDDYNPQQLAYLLSKNLDFYPRDGELRSYVTDLDENILVEKVIEVYKEAIDHFNLSVKG